jgi:NAD(P)H-flavin reductase/Fe-S-cluster-containing hydrogenase component 2
VVSQTAVPPSGTYFLARADFDLLIQALRADDREVIGPQVRDGAMMLGEVRSVSDLPKGVGTLNAAGSARLVERDDDRLFDQPPGPSSWKRWTFPPHVTQTVWPDAEMAHARDGHPQNPPRHAARKAFLGVRACEIAALRIQDRVLLEGPVADGDYATRRRDNLVVAVECAVAGGTCFCTSMGTGPEVTDGFDLALSELDDGFVVRVGSAAGWSAVEHLPLTPTTEPQVEAARHQVARVREGMAPIMPMDGLPERLVAAARSPRWQQIAERCLACTNCTLVCPTCFCTSVSQRSDLDGQNASTERSWDSCFTLDFARIAGGNFRPRTADRYRQWLTHKFGTWTTQFGTFGCVGCGRCITWCPVGIDVREELMAVAPPTERLARTLPVLPTFSVPAAAQGAERREAQRPMPWVAATVVDKWRETPDVVTLRLRTEYAPLIEGKPGQFVMASLPAVAAPPISVSRFHDDGFELTIRAAGSATARICAIERGETLSVRGPMGRGWPVEQAIGRDVVVITGGIGLAPLRPLLDWLVAERERVARIQLSYGARTPADRLYVDELDALARNGVIDVAQTVDRAGPEWLGRVGVVTQVIDRIMCSCDRTVAFICGPERMMQATVDVLRERGVPDDRIWVTLERHMDCGVGLCGHCQLGGKFVCKDGPVFSLAELGPAFGIEGL